MSATPLESTIHDASREDILRQIFGDIGDLVDGNMLDTLFIKWLIC